MVDVFVSYRRRDARADAGRLHDRLTAHLGDEHVFMDVDDIEPGEDFNAILEATLEQCNVLLVLIGADWLEKTADGRSRLQDPGDYVRLELSRALDRGITVIPILLDDTPMPTPGALPPPLRDLCERQAFRIGHERFHQDVDELIAALGATGSAWQRIAGWTRDSSRLLLAAALVLVGLAAVSAWILASEQTRRQSEVRNHVAVAEAFVGQGRLKAGILEYRQALTLDPDNLVLQRALATAAVERLQREAFLVAGSVMDVGLRPDLARFDLVPGAEIDAALRDLFVLAARDPGMDRDADHLLLQATLLKASGSRIDDAKALLAKAHELDPRHPGVLSELGLLRAVIDNDAGGVDLLLEAVRLQPGEARIQFYLARALSRIHDCTRRGVPVTLPRTRQACARSARAHLAAARAATAEDPWSRHIRASALRELHALLGRYMVDSTSMVTLPLPLSTVEKLQMLEALNGGKGRLRRGAREHPGFWLAQLYEADGRHGEARQLLQALVQHTGNLHEAWKPLVTRLVTPGDGAGAPQRR